MREIDADYSNCATGRDLRRLSRRANVYRGKISAARRENEYSPENEDKESPPKEIIKGDFARMIGPRQFSAGNQSSVHKANLLKGIKDRPIENTFYGWGYGFSEKGDPEIRTGMRISNKMPACGSWGK